MSIHIRVHFDGRVLVPDEPVDLPVNQPLEVEITLNGSNGTTSPSTPLSISERLDRLRQCAGRLSGPTLSNEALRRENLYDERL